ncbi:sodium/solute symporter [bacterium]|nr:sodium/solute symporter [bacterium]
MHNSGFSILNYGIISIYLGAMMAIGIWFAGRQKTGEDYFLAGRRMPWITVAMSMFASLTSAVTFMGLPGLAFKSNVTLAAVCIISPLLAPFLIFVMYPVYRRLNVTTSYEYIGNRFGNAPRLTVSALFLMARLGWLATVIYAPALALSVAAGISLPVCIVLMGGLATAYTALGGLSAVLWTDVVQFVFLVGGAVWIVCSLALRVSGGAAEIFSIASSTGHIAFDWSVDLYKMTLVSVSISFFFQMMQDYGTDQVTVQRLMAVRTRRGMFKAILFNAGTDSIVIALLLFIGIGLFAFFYQNPQALPNGLPSDRILPYYIIHNLPDGISGLLIAAIFAAAMSSMDSGIHSMSTVIVHDFIHTLNPQTAHSSRDVVLARVLTVTLGITATTGAFYVSRLEGIVEAFAQFMSLFNAPVLALFLLGMLSRTARFSGWCCGAACAVGITFYIQHYTELHWTYYFPVSLGVSWSIGYLSSRFFRFASIRRVSKRI